MISDKTKKVLQEISDTAVKGVEITVDIVDIMTPFVPGAAKVPVDILEGIVTTVLKQLPNWYEQGAAALGLNEHITINVPEPGAEVTGSIIR
jgi:hypothetical protein